MSSSKKPEPKYVDTPGGTANNLQVITKCFTALLLRRFINAISDVSVSFAIEI